MGVSRDLVVLMSAVIIGAVLVRKLDTRGAPSVDKRITEMSTVSESVAHDVSKPVESIIRHKLTSCLSPVHLEVINESYMHNAPKGSESHFKVVVVSEKFESLPLIKRHRLVNEALQQELQTSIHALSISVMIDGRFQVVFKANRARDKLIMGRIYFSTALDADGRMTFRMDLKVIGCSEVDWIELAQDRDSWHA
uniref:BolA-like protein n=1 Tax=Timema tahoe TaxID=61484 RepID=A0A7R9ID21_9NEOP|nr:unnamed protein product [Timema tahoe]